MIRYTKVIVDAKRQLQGFIAEVSGTKFFATNNAPVVRPYSLQEIVSNKMTNSQILVKDGQLIFRSGFEVNKLPMVVFVNGGFTEVPNSMTLVRRFVQKNENVGFTVRFGDGTEDNYRYSNIITLANWFRPENFVVKTASSGNKKFIAGKNGMQLDKLPTVVFGDEPKAKRTKSAAKPAEKTVNAILENGYDILDIYDFINSCKGCVINFASTDYKAVTGKSNDGAFTSYGIGEVTTTKPEFTANKLNVNAEFKKAGYVNIEINGMNQKITTFLPRKKSIFFAGESYIKEFGVAIPNENAKSFLDKLAGSLSISEITDKQIIAPLGQVIDTPSALTFYKVETSNLDIISKQKREKALMSGKDLVDILKKRYAANILTKYSDQRMRELEKSVGKDKLKKAAKRKIFAPFTMYNELTLKAMADNGINIFTGAYATGYVPKEKTSDKDIEAVKETEITIDYSLAGFDPTKVTAAKAKQLALSGDEGKVLPLEVKNIICGLESMSDNVVEFYNKLQELSAKAHIELSEINKRLWMHNASMYMAGAKSKVHSHDSKEWIAVNSRKKGETFGHKDCEGLTVTLNGISMA